MANGSYGNLYMIITLFNLPKSYFYEAAMKHESFAIS